MSRPSKGRLAQVAVASLAMGITAATAPLASAQTRKPNIVVIMADDLGWGDVGFNGQQHIRTPHLDAMARDGIVLTSHYSGSTVCMPSRCSLLTGYHMGHATVRGNPEATFTGLPVNLGPKDVTVAAELKRAGYTTAIIGKWGLAEGGDDLGMPQKHGFDYFYGYRTHGAAHHFYPTTLWRNSEEVTLQGNKPAQKEGQYTHDLFTEDALRWVKENRENPFFLYLAYTIPHYELTVPKDSKEPYENLDWPKKPMNTNGHYHHDAEGNVAYAGMVSRMDRDIGRLRQSMTELGLDKDTLIIFTSDNGPQFETADRFFNSNGPFRGGKRDLYEGGIRVPFVAVWPGKIKGGVKSDHPSAFWDLLPTACELAGIDPTKKDLDGISYLPTLLSQDGKQRSHEALYWEFNEGQGPIQAVRVGTWKAVRFVVADRVELYDLAADPGEKTNVAADNPQVVERMRQVMAESRTDDPAFKLERRPR